MAGRRRQLARLNAKESSQTFRAESDGGSLDKDAILYEPIIDRSTEAGVEGYADISARGERDDKEVHWSAKSQR